LFSDQQLPQQSEVPVRHAVRLHGTDKHFTYRLNAYFLQVRNGSVLKGKHLPAASMALRERFLLD
jgi:hypothetical protein